jgi:hypothetical protein
MVILPIRITYLLIGKTFRQNIFDLTHLFTVECHCLLFGGQIVGFHGELGGERDFMMNKKIESLFFNLINGLGLRHLSSLISREIRLKNNVSFIFKCIKLGIISPLNTYQKKTYLKIHN